MAAASNQLVTVDYIVFSVTVLLSVFIGIYYAYKERHSNTSLRFHRGGGKMNAFPVALSLIATFDSSTLFLGFPAEVYVHGFIFWLSNIALAMACLLMLSISIPLFYPLQITSVFEYLQIRHGSPMIRKLIACLSILYMTTYAGVVLFGPAIALESVTDIPRWLTIVCTTLLAVIYTSLGGIKAVVWTDVLQCLIMLSGIIAVLIKGIVTLGVSNIIDVNRKSGRIQLTDFNPDPLVRHTFWTLIVGGFFRYIGVCFKQPTIQRLNSTRSMSEARKVVFMSIPGFLIMNLLVMIQGLVAYAYFYNKGCDPLASRQISNPNQIIPFLVADMFGNIPGISGIYLAALFSASLSTISSFLSSTSAVISEDIVRPIWKDITDEKLTKVSKIIVVAFGALSICVGLIIGKIEGPMSQIAVSVLGGLSGPQNGIFVMSIFVSWITQPGIVAGALTGVAFALWLATGYNFSTTRKHTSWLPLGPTDQCLTNVSNIMDNLTTYSTVPYSTSVANNAEIATSVSAYMSTPTLSPMDDSAVHGIDYLYSISYQYFGLMVLIVTVFVILVVSKLTQPDNPRNVPPHLMLSLKQLIDCRKRAPESTRATDASTENSTTLDLKHVVHSASCKY